MTKQVQRRRGTATQHTSFTGAEGEISVNTTNKSVHVHDGVTAGGVEAARADLSNVSEADVSAALAGATDVDINGGNIDGTVIGANSAAAITGTTITGTSFVSSGDMTFGDNDKAIFGAGSDLQIYHDGIRNYIDSDTTELRLQTSELRMVNSSNTEVGIKAVEDGAVTLYYDGNPQLATTSTGIDVTGTVTADGLTVDGIATLNAVDPYVRFNASTSVDYNIGASSAGGFYIYDVTNSATRLFADDNGDISFYEDTGTTAKFFWDASLEALGVGITPSTAMHIYSGSGNTALRVETGLTNGQAEINFKNDARRYNVGINSSDNLHFVDDTAGATRMTIDSSGRVGIGTSSPWDTLSIPFGKGLSFGSATYPLTISRSAAGQLVTTIADGYDSSSSRIDFVMREGAAAENTALSITGNGNVGIGTDSPVSPLDIYTPAGTEAKLVVRNGTSTSPVASIELRRGATSQTFGADSYGDYRFKNEGGNLSFEYGESGATTERMRIDSSGRVGIGTSSPQRVLVLSKSDSTGVQSQFTNSTTGTGASAGFTVGIDGSENAELWNYENTNMIFATNSIERMRITSSGSVGIGTSSPDAKLDVEGGRTFLQSSSGDQYVLRLTNPANVSGVFLGNPENNSLAVYTAAGTERLRLDASGNLLVGTTSTTAPIVNNGGAGVVIRGSNGQIYAGGADTQPLTLNRETSDGDIVQFRKDGSTVGSIGVDDNVSHTTKTIYISSSNTASSLDVGFKFDWNTNQITPCQSGGTNRDNGIDLGSSSVRFDDIYATNGTIQTSDRNEKQDIATLTATEMLVAARISAMFKTFRWIDSVADNPNARTHTGIIAQDVQQAFTDEGLDAGDYSLFISTTWWEADGETYDTQADAPAGATERTRMGIRYPELLSFIAAYNDQRFASIEARLTALENN